MAAPSKVNFDNVTSMGVSYEWSHGQGAALPCPGITNTGKWIQRVKTIDLEVANLDLGNEGGSVVEDLSTQQDDYVNTETHSIYANGYFAGNGYLTSYSVAEGSLSNVSTTNLSYTMRDGGDPNEGEEQDDPVERTESIKVSRDIKGKSYTIEHSYSVSFGSDFDLVTDHPLYGDNAEYKSVDGRLALAEQEAYEVVGADVTNYNNYLDLSPYTLGNGFDFAKINEGCSGVFTTSNSSSNYINGDFSYSKSTVLRYTGADLADDVDPYEISYSMGWDQKKEEGGYCVVLTFDGSIVANEGSVPNCKTGEGAIGAGDIAESGFKEWVTDSDAKGITRVKEFYNSIQDTLAIGGDNYPLVEEILNYRKDECVPSVDKGGSNDGTINFEFEMSTCPDQQAEDGTQYDFQESTNVSYSQGGCKGATRRITDIGVEGSVNGKCGRNLGESGDYPKWSSTDGAYETKKAAALLIGPATYEGPYKLRLAAKSTSINKYEGQGGYSFSWTDSPWNENCDPASSTGCDPNFSVSTKRTDSPATTRYVNTITAAGTVSEKKGETLPRASSSIKIQNNLTGKDFALTIDNAMKEAKCQLEIEAPSCVIETITVQIDKSQNDGADRLSVNATIGGVQL